LSALIEGVKDGARGAEVAARRARKACAVASS